MGRRRAGCWCLAEPEPAEAVSSAATPHDSSGSGGGWHGDPATLRGGGSIQQGLGGVRASGLLGLTVMRIQFWSLQLGSCPSCRWAFIFYGLKLYGGMESYWDND